MLRFGIKDKNKHQLLHRISSVQTPLIYNTRLIASLYYFTKSRESKNGHVASKEIQMCTTTDLDPLQTKRQTD